MELIKENNVKEKSKEYKNILKYEGDYFMGKRSGKGKEYDINGELIYEGEYINGEIKKEKFKFNKDEIDKDFLVFKGHLKNGLKDGIIKEYEKGKLIFEGEYLNGKRNGKGIQYSWRGHLEFEGEYLNDEKWNGKIYNNNGIIFEIKNGNGKVK